MAMNKFIIGFILLFAFTQCGGDDESSVLGIWEGTFYQRIISIEGIVTAELQGEIGATLEFRSDNTFIFSDPSGFVNTISESLDFPASGDWTQSSPISLTVNPGLADEVRFDVFQLDMVMTLTTTGEEMLMGGQADVEVSLSFAMSN